MPNWLEFQRGTKDLSAQLGEYAQRKRATQDAIQMMLMKAQIEQAFKSPFEKITDFAKVSKSLYDIGIDPRIVFGEDATNISAEQPTQREIIPVDKGAMLSPRIGGEVSPSLGINNLEPTEFEPTPFGIRPTKFGMVGAKAEEEITKGAVKTTAKLTEKYAESMQNFSRVANLFGQLVGQGKLMAEQQGGMGIAPALKGKIGRFGVRLTGKTSKEINPYEGFGGISGFEGQLEEVTLGMSPILTGQNRVLRGVLKMIRKTLPSVWGSEFDFASQTKQSLKNAFRLSLAFGKNIMNVDELKSLNKQSESVINNKLNELVNKIQLTNEENAIFENIWQSIRATPAEKPVTLFGQDFSNSNTTQPSPQGITEEDIQFTMRKHNLSREEVLRRIK